MKSSNDRVSYCLVEGSVWGVVVRPGGGEGPEVEGDE